MSLVAQILMKKKVSGQKKWCPLFHNFDKMTKIRKRVDASFDVTSGC